MADDAMASGTQGFERRGTNAAAGAGQEDVQGVALANRRANVIRHCERSEAIQLGLPRR
jgi:hypothetical protein